MFVKHPLAECSEFLPLVSPILIKLISHTLTEIYVNTYDEPFVSNGDGEVALKGDPIIVRIISLITNDVFKKSGLMTENF